MASHGELEAERGHAVRGERAIKLGEWLSLRDVDGGPKEFERLVKRLAAAKWRARNPEKRKAIALRYAHKLEPKKRQRELEVKRRRRRWIASNPARACGDCGVDFCPVKPARRCPRTYCSTKCAARARWHRTHRGASRRPRS